MSTLLVIDDEESVRYSFRYIFGEGEGEVEVLTAATAAEGLAIFQERRPDVVVLDLQLPDRSGLAAFQEMRNIDATRPVVFVTAHGTTETAIEAMRHGAFDYLVKPLNLERLNQVLTRALEVSRLLHAPASKQDENELVPPPFTVLAPLTERMIGHSAVMQEMCKAIGRIAPQEVNVLILGESGTGKELVARALYQHSLRAEKPFVAVNCAAMAENLLESELFGHEQGAFPGASRRRIGKFEQCDGGTIFLDEIGDLTAPLQAKILRVLKEQRFERVGGDEVLYTNVRVLAATHQNLDALVQGGGFRKELYYRLKGACLEVPALRDRLEDVAELADFFRRRCNSELNTDVRAIAPETLELLQGYSWPGNVRELQGVIREAMIQASGHILFSEFLPVEFRKQAVEKPPDKYQAARDKELGLSALIDSLLKEDCRDLHGRILEEVERILLPRVLRHTQTNLTRASEILGLSRNTLRQKMRALGLGMDKVLTEEPAEPE